MIREVTTVVKDDPYFRPELVTVTEQVVTIITRDNKVCIYNRTPESE